jgi:hypothetical protein
MKSAVMITVYASPIANPVFLIQSVVNLVLVSEHYVALLRYLIAKIHAYKILSLYTYQSVNEPYPLS